MKFKEPGFSTSRLIEMIIGLSIALLIFASLAPTVSSYLVPAQYSDNPIAQVVVPLVTVVFIVGVLLAVFYGLVGHRKM